MVCTTRISPMTVITVVEVVGVIPGYKLRQDVLCSGIHPIRCKRTVGLPGDDNEFQARIQVVGQLG